MVSDLKTFAHKGCKIAAAKKAFFMEVCSFVLSVFRFSESLGTSNGKKGCQIYQTFVHKEYKISAQKSFIFAEFCLTSRFFFGMVLLSALVKRFFVSRMLDFPRCFIVMIILAISGNFPGVIMTIVLRRKIQYHLLQVSKDDRVKLHQNWKVWG